MVQRAIGVFEVLAPMFFADPMGAVVGKCAEYSLLAE